MSKSVTVRPVFAELLLQIEILRLDISFVLICNRQKGFWPLVVTD